VGEKVLLELDGIHHFCLDSMEMTDKTQTRNLHLLFKGYRMVLVNIYEYNVAREQQELKELILAKLELLKQKDAVLVL
jgi:very-short-patch-repair endonuclease